MDVINEIKLQVIDEFLLICRLYSNGNMDYCYLDTLSKIQFIEMKDYVEHLDLFEQLFLN